MFSIAQAMLATGLFPILCPSICHSLCPRPSARLCTITYASTTRSAASARSTIDLRIIKANFNYL